MSVTLKEAPFEEQQNDNFKQIFKYFKAKKPIPDFSRVLNLHQYKQNIHPDVCVLESCNLSPELENVRESLGVRDTKSWCIYSLENHPGLQIISNAFTHYGTMIWIRKCLQEFTAYPFKTNLSNLKLCSEEHPWWPRVKENLIRNTNQKLITQLRWATMGYHHNWDTKIYSADEISPIPDDLENLCKLFLSGVGHNHSNFKAEAAIVNYYPPGTTLSPHTDHSEPCKEAPLLSFSFGRSGIFLIGGKDRNSIPTPVYLHHGDVMIMSRESRLSYHAVPRIISNDDLISCVAAKSEQVHFIETWQKILANYELSEARVAKNLNKINLNELIETFDADETLQSHDVNDINCSNAVGNTYLNEKIMDLGHDDLLAIINYIKTVRININVRQVND